MAFCSISSLAVPNNALTSSAVDSKATIRFYTPKKGKTMLKGEVCNFKNMLPSNLELMSVFAIMQESIRFVFL